MSDKCEAVVIGTGFGGAINACRLARHWPGKVVVLERGKRYGLGEFPRAPADFARNFWVLPDRTPRPKHVCKAARRAGARELHGMYDVRNYDHMDVVVCAGVGGGSLIYANVFLVPPDDVFADPRWPASCKKDNLTPYYAVAKSVLGSRPIPSAVGDPRRHIHKTELFQTVAKKAHRDSQLLDINVFFGKDFNTPLPIGKQCSNRFGALQTSCTYCGECVCGCNYHAKNTVDLNYLYVAENVHHAEVRTEHLVQEIVPVNSLDADDCNADGSNGYRVKFRDLKANTSRELLTKRVVVSAGCLGSTELLLRCKRVLHTLPNISDRLGQQFSGNGDFLSFVIGGFNGEPNYGPTITQATDYNLFRDFAPGHAFILEDASYPAFLSWFVEGARPRLMWWKPISRLVRHLLTSITSGKSPGVLGYAFADVLSDCTSEQRASNSSVTSERRSSRPCRPGIGLYGTTLPCIRWEGACLQKTASTVSPMRILLTSVKCSDIEVFMLPMAPSCQQPRDRTRWLQSLHCRRWWPEELRALSLTINYAEVSLAVLAMSSGVTGMATLLTATRDFLRQRIQNGQLHAHTIAAMIPTGNVMSAPTVMKPRSAPSVSGRASNTSWPARYQITYMSAATPRLIQPRPGWR
jgi:cholesterol oxidase